MPKLTRILFAFVAALALTLAATAQSHTIAVHVPYSFNVAGRALPPGNYTFQQMNDVSLRISSSDRRINFLVAVQPTGNGTISKESKIMLRRYGTAFVFAGAWMAGTSRGVQAITTSLERKLQNASKGADPRVIALNNK